MSTRIAHIVCIAQTTLEIINNVLLIHNWRFMFFWFEYNYHELENDRRTVEMSLNVNLFNEIVIFEKIIGN